MSRKEVRSRGWCFTINNYTDTDIAYIMDMYESDVNCKYIMVGFEAGKAGTPHMQCYAYFTNQLRKNEFQKKLWGKFHFEPQSAAKNVNAYSYCVEEHDWFEMGERPRQGHRSDLWMIIHDIIDKKKPREQIMKEYPQQECQYFRSFDRYYEAFVKHDTKVYGFALDGDPFSTMQQVHCIYDPKMDLLVQQYAMDSFELANAVQSRKYRYVFVAAGPFVDKHLNDRLDGMIGENGIELFS